MLSTGKTPALRFAAAITATTAVLTAILAGGSSAALAASAHFVPEATEVDWDGVVATVSFREVEVEVEGGETTISVKVTADVQAVCTKGESTLHIRRSATALDVANYPISDDGVVAGTAKLPLEVKGVQVPGYSCVTRHRSVTVELEDFWTGATLVHKT